MYLGNLVIILEALYNIREAKCNRCILGRMCCKMQKVLQFYCHKCDYRMFDCILTGDRNQIVCQGIKIKCRRCRHITTINLLTQDMLV